MKSPRLSSSRKAGANLTRRGFLKTTAALSAGAALPLLDRRAEAGASSDKPPNLLFILVDEMRFPTVFPAGVHSPGEFLQQVMPNTFKLWRDGVKFANNYTAGTACTPARGVLVSGLYTQQSWLVLTIVSLPGQPLSIQPVLNRAYPTYGKLLRQAGYRTPYIGKWHLSIPPASEGRLEDYGFEGLTYPDPTGFNLQGTIGNTTKCGSDISACYLSDQDIANQAAGWLSDRKPHENPWCLTVGFVNPHDKEFFPAGTESQTFKQLFSSGALNPDKLMQWTDYTNAKAPVGVPWGQDLLKAPPSNGYPPLPPNWESLDHLQANKPGCQTVAHQFMAMVWGGVSDERTEGAFSVVPYPQPPNTWGVGTAPFTYWQRSLDSYTQIQNLLDGRIGEVLAALPPAVAANTVVIFTSDHGEYAGAHGFVSGKTSTAYNEALRVPLIVFDPTGRFTGDIDIVRPQLTSSVDLLPLMVSLGYNGSRDWMQGDLAALYGRRYDMLPILRSASRPGRPYVLFATDETLANEYNFLNAPTHMVGIRTEDAKLAVYVNWAQSSTDIQWQGDVDVEFYDYSTPGGRAEVDNMPDDPRAADLFDLLKDNLVPNELRAALPPPLVPPQEQTQQHLIDYLDFVDEVPHAQWVAGAGVTILGYGLNVP